LAVACEAPRGSNGDQTFGQVRANGVADASRRGGVARDSPGAVPGPGAGLSPRFAGVDGFAERPEARLLAYPSGFRGPHVPPDSPERRSNGEPKGSLVQGAHRDVYSGARSCTPTLVLLASGGSVQEQNGSRLDPKTARSCSTAKSLDVWPVRVVGDCAGARLVGCRWRSWWMPTGTFKQSRADDRAGLRLARGGHCGPRGPQEE